MTKIRTDAIANRVNGPESTEERTTEYNLRMEDLLGACWLDQSIELKSTNVVFGNGELEPRIVIKQEGMVTMVKTTNSQDPENPVNHCSLGHRPSTRTPWNVDESGD